MYIQMKQIQDLFSDFPSNSTDTTRDFCLSSFMFIRKNSLPPSVSEHCLYVTDDPDIPGQLTSPPYTSFLILTEDLSAQVRLPEDTPISVMKLQTKDADMVCRRLQEFFDDKCGMGLFAESLLEILFFEGGIPAMLEKTYPAFQNPIYVFDPDFRLIAFTKGTGPCDEQSKKIVESGGFSEKEFEVLNLSRVHDKMKHSEYPIRSTHPLYGFDQLLCAIDTKKDMGHIVINGINRELTEMDRQLMYILKKAIDQQMKKDEFICNNRGFHYEYFLRDLLDGKLAVGKQDAGRMNYVNDMFSGNLYCMVIETARSSRTLNTSHIRSCFETDFPDCITLMYKGQIIIIFRLPDQHSLNEDDYAKITAVCLEYGLYAGIGNSFRNIMHVGEYYKQALRSIELGICRRNEPSLFSYQDYYLDHMANIFTQKESAETFCHPQMKILMEYDRRHDTDYAHILYTYLICERNIAATAQALYMHRNTLVYRLKKINTLISVNYESYPERQHIILSYELSRK